MGGHALSCSVLSHGPMCQVAKLDEMPVLIGRGGIGKSTALRYILPPVHARAIQ